MELKGMVLRLFLGLLFLSFAIVAAAPLLRALVGIDGANVIGSGTFFGYVFGAYLYVERLRSKDWNGFWRRKGTISVLILIAVYIAGLVWALIAKGVL